MKKIAVAHKLVFIFLVSVIFCMKSISQQWAGSSSTTGLIYRYGCVSINTNYSNAGTHFNVAGTQWTTHFHHGDNEDVYLRPGKSTGKIIMDHGNIKIANWISKDGVANEGIKFNSDGYVGIRTEPTHALDVNGVFTITGSGHFIFGHTSGNGVINFGNNGNGDLYFRSLPTGNNYNTYNQLMILTYDGNLGIGTTDPGDYKLAVNGGILAKSIVV